MQPKPPLMGGGRSATHSRVLGAFALLMSTSAVLIFLADHAGTATTLLSLPNSWLPPVGGARSRRSALEEGPRASAAVPSGLPGPPGLWLQLISQTRYNVPCASPNITTAHLAAIMRLHSAAASRQQGCEAEQLAALRQATATLAALQHSSRNLHSTAALRRLSTAVLLGLNSGGSTSSDGGTACPWGRQHELLRREALVLWLSIHLQSAVGKAIEYTHMSKAGGTSLCQLAVAAGCANPYSSLMDNCLVPAFGDYPLWTQPVRVQHYNDSYTLRPFCAYDCPTYHMNGTSAYPVFDCHTRAFNLRSKRINFYAQERTLHGGSPSPASSQVCPQLLNVITIRQPLKHVVSHMLEVLATYEGYINKFSSLLRTYVLPASLPFWQRLAPAVVDNYYTRTLLGRFHMCLPFGGVHASHVSHAVAKLLAYDVILDLDQDRRQQDAILQLGLGWAGSLAEVHERQGTRRIECIGLRAEDVLPSLEAWNVHDLAVYSHANSMAQLDAAFFTAASQHVREQAAAAASPGAGPTPGLGHLPAERVAAMAAALNEKQACGYVMQKPVLPAGVQRL